MDIFNSEWLIGMLEKSSKLPEKRMLNLFDVLNDWMQAPGIALVNTGAYHFASKENALVAFLTLQAKSCGAQHPAMLAEHIVLIARNAVELTLQHPKSTSLGHAKKVASALITAQTQKSVLMTWLRELASRLSNPSRTFGITTSVVATLVAAVIWLPASISFQTNTLGHRPMQTATQVTKITHLQLTKAVINKNQLSAGDAAKMYSKYEEMRNGTCQFPEALQIPDKDKAIYLENVVGGKLPNNLDDLAVAIRYLEKVRCNFTPMLMAKST